MFIGRGRDCGMAFSILGCKGKLHNQDKVEKFKKIRLEVFVIPTTNISSNGAKQQRVGTLGSSCHATIEEHELGCNLDLSTKQIPPTSSTISVEGSFIIELDLKSIMIPQEIV